MQASPSPDAAISDSRRTRVGSPSALKIRAVCSASSGVRTPPVRGVQHTAESGADRSGSVVGMGRFSHVVLTFVDASMILDPSMIVDAR